MKFYRTQLSVVRHNQDWSLLDHIPNLITEEENDDLIRLLDDMEVKKAVFGLNGDSVAGLGRFLRAFF